MWLLEFDLLFAPPFSLFLFFNACCNKEHVRFGQMGDVTQGWVSLDDGQTGTKSQKQLALFNGGARKAGGGAGALNFCS